MHLKPSKNSKWISVEKFIFRKNFESETNIPWERALALLTFSDILWENIEAVAKRRHIKVVAVKCFTKSQENIRFGVLF